jgi:hypothetical protein
MSTLCDYQLIEPDIVVSKGDRLAGTISFDALLRVDGEFEGRGGMFMFISCSDQPLIYVFCCFSCESAFILLEK